MRKTRFCWVTVFIMIFSFSSSAYSINLFYCQGEVTYENGDIKTHDFKIEDHGYKVDLLNMTFNSSKSFVNKKMRFDNHLFYSNETSAAGKTTLIHDKTFSRSMYWINESFNLSKEDGRVTASYANSGDDYLDWEIEGYCEKR